MIIVLTQRIGNFSVPSPLVERVRVRLF